MTDFSGANGQGPGYGGEVLSGEVPYTPAPAPLPYATAPPQVPMVVNNVVASPVVVAQKSTGVAFLLTFFFGPFGLFYSSVTGGLIMTLVGIPLSIVTFGVLGFFVWVGSIIWGCAAADAHNKRAVPAVAMVAPSMSYMAPQPTPFPAPAPVAPPQPPSPAPAPAYELAPAPVEAGLGDTCPACAAPWRAGTQFCTTCGARRDQVPAAAVVVEASPAGGATFVVRRCPEGHAVDAANAFCPRCGGAAS